MNRAVRDMFVSDYTFVWQCGYPREVMAGRTALVDRLYREGGMDPEQSALLRALARPVYVFYEGKEKVVRPPAEFEPVFRQGNTEIYRWKGSDGVTGK